MYCFFLVCKRYSLKMALRRIYSKYFLSKTYPAIFTSRRKIHKENDKYEYDEEEEMEEWESPEQGPSIVERGNAEREGITPEQYRFLQQDIDFSLPTLKRKAIKRKYDKAKEEQQFSLERYDKLGSELAAAHFIVGRLGAVKLKDRNNWIRLDGSGAYPIPRWKVDGIFVEGIDASNTDLMYEGLKNLGRPYSVIKDVVAQLCDVLVEIHMDFPKVLLLPIQGLPLKDLQELKFLNLTNCKYIDDFCLSRLQMFKDSLEVLDISGCERVTENGIACLHHLPKLKLLSIENTPNIKHKEILTFYIEEMLPNCLVHGVDHDAILQSGNDSIEERVELPDQLQTNKMIEKLLETEEKTASEVYKEVSMQENDNSLKNDDHHQQHIDCSNSKQEEKVARSSSS